MSVWFILFGAQLSALLLQVFLSISQWSHCNTFHDALISAVFFRSKMLTRNLNYTCTICWILDELPRHTLVSCHLAHCAVTPFVGFRLPGGHGGVRTCAQFVYCVVLWSTLSAMHWPMKWLASWSSVSSVYVQWELLLWHSQWAVFWCAGHRQSQWCRYSGNQWGDFILCRHRSRVRSLRCYTSATSFPGCGPLMRQ